MQKQIFSFFLAFLLGISLPQTASLAQETPQFTVYSRLVYSAAPNNCYQGAVGQGVCCNISADLYLDWYRNSPTNVYWCGAVFAGDAYGYSFPIDGGPSYNQGTWHEESLSGTLCANQLENESQVFSVGEYYSPYPESCNNTPSVGAKAAPLSNIIGAPIGSPGLPLYGPSTAPILLPTDKMTLTKDPINIATGEAYFSSTDFSLNGRGPILALFRKYRSFSTLNGMFGYGWRTDFDINLSQDSNGDVTIYNGEGTGIYFMNISTIYFASPAPSPGNYSVLIKNADNTFTVTDKHGKVSHYDINGRLSSRTDRNGNALSFVYNPSVSGGTYIQDAGGRQIKLYFDANGHVISAVDPVGKTFQYGYDTNGNLVSVTDPTGAVTNYTYNANHQIIQFTNANGHNTYYQYDSQGRVISNYQDSNVNKVALNYEANNTTVVTDSLGNNNTYVFNSYGLLLSHTDPLGAVTQQAWDAFMNRISKTDARNNTTSFTYDGEGNLIQIIDPLNNQTTMSYTSNFNLISSKTDALGNLTNFVYDINGNLTSITDALGHMHSFAYDQYGDVLTVTDTRGNSAAFTYDAYGHVLQKTDALGHNINFIYE